MQKRNPSCDEINDLVKKYFFVIKNTFPGSEERKVAGNIYNKIIAFTLSNSNKKFNLNQLAPHTLQFLTSRGLNLQIRRAGEIKLKKKTKKIKRPKVWDYR